MNRILLFLAAGILPSIASLNGNGTPGSSPIVRNFQSNDFYNVVAPVASYPIASGGSVSTNAPSSGRIFQQITATIITGTNLQMGQTTSGALSNSIRTPVWSSSNTNICTVNSLGFVTQTGTGTATVTCQTANPLYLAPYASAFTSQTNQTVLSFLNWQIVSPVSLPAHLNSQVDGLITMAGTFSSSKQNLFSAANDITGVYTRNTTVWTGSVDLSGIPCSTNASGTWTGSFWFGGLITPTDLVVANHIVGNDGRYLNGCQIRFCDASNVAYTATCAGHVNVNGDLTVVHITWNGGITPSTLKVMPVLPSAYQTYCPDHALNFFPVICTNQFRQVFVQDSQQTVSGSNSSFAGGQFYHNPASEANRAPWTLAVIGNDSSNPVMVVINGFPVLLCCNYTIGNGPSVADNISAINTALAGLGSSYAVTTVNVTNPIAFPTY